MSIKSHGRTHARTQNILTPRAPFGPPKKLRTRLAVAVNMHGQALALNLGLIIPMHRIRWPNGIMSVRVLATFTLKAR